MKNLAIWAAALAALMWTIGAIGEAKSPTSQREDQLVAMIHRIPHGVKRPEQRETALQRQRRIRIIARAVVDVSEKERGWLPRKVATAAIYTLWYYESRFDREVHAGGLSRWGSDTAKARCMGQLHVSKRLPTDEWKALAGIDYAATRRCAVATLHRFRSAAGWCGWGENPHRWRDAFRNYGSGSCERAIKTEQKRVRMAETLSWRLL